MLTSRCMELGSLLWSADMPSNGLLALQNCFLHFALEHSNVLLQDNKFITMIKETPQFCLDFALEVTLGQLHGIPNQVFSCQCPKCHRTVLANIPNPTYAFKTAGHVVCQACHSQVVISEYRSDSKYHAERAMMEQSETDESGED